MLDTPHDLMKEQQIEEAPQLFILNYLKYPIVYDEVTLPMSDALVLFENTKDTKLKESILQTSKELLQTIEEKETCFEIEIGTSRQVLKRFLQRRSEGRVHILNTRAV